MLLETKALLSRIVFMLISFATSMKSRESPDMSKPVRAFGRVTVLLIASLLVTGIWGNSAFAGSVQSKKLAPVTSLAALDRMLAKSIKQKKLPDSLTPSLQSTTYNPLGVQGFTDLRSSCDPYTDNREARDPVPCWFGSKTAKRTVVIWGDSFVGNWLPALNIAGKTLGFKLAVFEFSGCTVTFYNSLPTGPGFDQNEVNACIEFHNNLPNSVHKIAPVAVIAANGDPSWGTQGDAGFITDLGKAFDEMSTATNHPVRILLGTGPHLSVSAPVCLSSHPTSINLCNLTYGSGSAFSVALLRDQNSISGAQVHLIPTYRWICLHGVCPDVIGNIETYVDSDHLSISMSEYLSILLEKSLSPLLHASS